MILIHIKQVKKILIGNKFDLNHKRKIDKENK